MATIYIVTAFMDFGFMGLAQKNPENSLQLLYFQNNMLLDLGYILKCRVVLLLFRSVYWYLYDCAWQNTGVLLHEVSFK